MYANHYTSICRFAIKHVIPLPFILVLLNDNTIYFRGRYMKTNKYEPASSYLKILLMNQRAIHIN